jgi:hypothetical protein
MKENSRPNKIAQWILFVLSAIPIVVGVYDNLTVSGPGDQRMSAGMGLAFFFIPISFLFAAISALLTCFRWKATTIGDRVWGMIPLSFPIIAVLIVSYL